MFRSSLGRSLISPKGNEETGQRGERNPTDVVTSGISSHFAEGLAAGLSFQSCFKLRQEGQAFLPSEQCVFQCMRPNKFTLLAAAEKRALWSWRRGWSSKEQLSTVYLRIRALRTDQPDVMGCFGFDPSPCKPITKKGIFEIIREKFMQTLHWLMLQNLPLLLFQVMMSE